MIRDIGDELADIRFFDMANWFVRPHHKNRRESFSPLSDETSWGRVEARSRWNICWDIFGLKLPTVVYKYMLKDPIVHFIEDRSSPSRHKQSFYLIQQLTKWKIFYFYDVNDLAHCNVCGIWQIWIWMFLLYRLYYKYVFRLPPPITIGSTYIGFVIFPLIFFFIKPLMYTCHKVYVEL